jgi:hypothetical protein
MRNLISSFVLKLLGSAPTAGQYLRVANVSGRVLTLDFASSEGASNGLNGREVEFRKSDAAIQSRYVGDPEWTDLILLSEITGSPGANGINGEPGADGDSVGDTANLWFHAYPGISPSTVTLIANRVYFIPITLKPKPWCKLGVNVTTPVTGATINAALYADSAGRPTGAPLHSTAINAAASGNQFGTISPGTIGGRFWLALTTAATGVAISSDNGQSAGGIARKQLGLDDMADSDPLYFYQATTGGTLPNVGALTAVGAATATTPRLCIRWE